jgi:RNase H-fold protein (predicted Holliday junction resolvase)
MILGIDFGLKNIGLALSAGQLAEPLEQFKYLDLDKALGKLADICQLHQVEKIVVGLPDGPIVSQVKDFSNQLKMKT